MAIDTAQIVREVIAELQRLHGANETASPAASAAPAPAVPVKDQRELALSSRVVTMADVAARLGGIRRLIVPPGAIITPAVRDVLADRDITVSYGSATQPASGAATRLLVVAALTRFDPNSLAGALRGDAIDVEIQTSDCLIQTSDTLAERVRDAQTLALVLTPHTAAAMCLANRQAGVRAVSAANAGAAVHAARAVGANVLIVDPHGQGLFQLKQCVAAFCRSGPWPCPEVLRPRLA
ncbi:MAG: hypothetical protein JW888_18290 [Pirellulales bacterium]|nr:hypothetical protein [Pirellulales bacterium]